MNVKAYRLYDQAVTLQSAATVRREGPINPALAGEAGIARATQQGWVLLCPLAFEATWNGGPRPEDIEIRLEGGDAAHPAFVQSQAGDGLLTFYPGYQFKTASSRLLWVRGPLNAPKDGLAPLESLVDASLLPATVAIHWQFTRPHQTIHFAAGEPFAMLLLYRQNGLAALTVEVMGVDEGEDAYVRAFQQMSEVSALQGLFQQLADPVAPVVSTLTLPGR